MKLETLWGGGFRGEICRQQYQFFPFFGWVWGGCVRHRRKVIFSGKKNGGTPNFFFKKSGGTPNFFPKNWGYPLQFFFFGGGRLVREPPIFWKKVRGPPLLKS